MQRLKLNQLRKCSKSPLNYSHRTKKDKSEGKQYALSEPYLDITAMFIDVAVGTQSFGGITGMKNTAESEAIVEYTVVFDQITPFGEVLKVKPETFTVKATMNKYDDGWRVEKTVRKR